MGEQNLKTDRHDEIENTVLCGLLSSPEGCSYSYTTYEKVPDHQRIGDADGIPDGDGDSSYPVCTIANSDCRNGFQLRQLDAVRPINKDRRAIGVCRSSSEFLTTFPPTIPPREAVGSCRKAAGML